MANIIQHKRNSTPGVIPAATGLQQAELGINIGDGKLYTKNSNNNIINLGVTSISGTYITPASGNFSNYLAVSGIPVSLNGHSHTSVPQAQSLVTNVFNKTASTIPKFSVVYINGGQGDQPTIQLAIANGESGSSKTYGITAEAISSMSAGSVIVAGSLSGVNTDQFNPTAPTGDVNGITLYLSPSVSGAATTTKPYAPNHLVSIGTIVRTHQNEGVIEVRVQNGFELQELHNVAITGVTNGQFLQYNDGSGLWLASNTGNFTSLQLNGTGVVASTGGTNGYLSKFIGSNTINNSLIYDDGTNIGIGTTSPIVKLQVAGDTYANNILSSGYLITDYILALNDFDGGSPGTINIGEFTSFNQVYWSIDQNGSGNFSTLSVNDVPVSLNGHTHSSSDITNFNSSVSGLLPTIANSGDNRVLTSTGSSVGINAESNLTFDGTTLNAPLIISTQAVGDEGGEIQLAKAPNGSLSGSIVIDSYQNKLRFFENGGTARGFYLDISAGGAGASTNIGGGGSATTVSNYADNRIITSDGTTTGLNAETNFTFNGNLLNVTGSGSFSNNVTASGFIRTGGTSSQFLKADGSIDSTSYQSSLTNPVTGTGIASHIAYWNSSSGITADSGQLYWDSTNNRLGIGTNSPGATLDVRGSAVFNENGADADFRIEGDTDANLVFVDASTDRVGIGYDTPTTKLQVNGTFSCGGGGGGDPSSGGQGLYVDPVTPLLRFNDSGPNYVADIDVNGLTLYDVASSPFFYTDRANARIGIGTNTPATALDVNGVTKTLGFNSYGISWFGSSDGSIGIGVNDNPTGTFGSASAFAAFQGFNDSISSYNAICFTTLYAPQLYLNTDGNVGIGTATPSYNLDVNGTIGDSTNGYIVIQDLTISNSTAGIIGIDSASNDLSIGGDGTITISSAVDEQVDINANVDISGNLTFNSYTEKVVSNGNSGTSKTLSLDSGTVHTCTLTGNCTFTMPTATAGKSFTLFLNTGSGGFTAIFTGVRWSDSTPPTITSTASKVDLLSFISDGTYWYGSFSQNYG